MNRGVILKNLKKEKYFVAPSAAKKFEYVVNVLNKLKIKTLKNYHNQYLKLDVLLLADVFEKFRNNKLTNYGLSPSHYLRPPGIIWDAMLKIKKKLELELITNADMYIFFEKNKKSRVSNISNDIAKSTIKM